MSEDIRRAVRSFLSAVSPDPDDHESGESLCDILDREGKDVLQVFVCQEASSKSRKAFWAYRRLGYLQVNQEKWSEAVHNLQYAIRGFPTCVDLWEALGLAYQRLGMSMAALKAYERAIKLDDSRIFSIIESGNIFLTVSSFQKGIDRFKHALEIFPQHTAASYGLASALYCWSRDCICSGALRWASSMLKEASVIAKETALLAGNFSCVWKLNGDIQLSIAKWCPWTEDGIKVKLNKESFYESLVVWERTRSEAAFLASKYYQRALHMTPWRANIYSDICLTLDLISSFATEGTSNGWQLAEKMALGSLLLEGDNSGFWIALGCVSDSTPLKQHAFIRGLQLDPSLAVAWAYLGKIYRTHGMRELSVRAFDLCRSIDPSLPLPWASLSEDLHSSGNANGAYECILRATEMFPVVEFQLGLAVLSLFCGHISNPQVFTAIHQAAQLAPHSPEIHNLKGLVFESHNDYDSAISSYNLAKYAVSSNCDDFQKSRLRGISLNLARALCMAGNYSGAELEYEILNKEGDLDHHDLKLFAISLWRLGKNQSALSTVKKLAGNIPSMDHIEADRSLVFICRLVYSVSGLDVAINSIMKLPKELLKNSGIRFIVSAVDSLDQSNRLDSSLLNDRFSLATHEEIISMHHFVALSKLLKHGSGNHRLQYNSGIAYLKRAIHLFPGDRLLRNLLGYLMLSSEEWKGPHMAVRCCIIESGAEPVGEGRGLRRANEVVAAASVACYSSGSRNPSLSFCSCASFGQSFPSAILQLQKWLHQEPWNPNSRYLLIMNLMQRAREEHFPRHLLTSLRRMTLLPLPGGDSFSNLSDSMYTKFQLLLCSSEICLQSGEFEQCILQAASASALSLPDEGLLLFPHLLLCRAYAAQGDALGMREEYARCLRLRSDHGVGWISLRVLESRYGLLDGVLESPCFRKCPGESTWVSVSGLFRGLAFLRNGDVGSAGEMLSRLSVTSSTADDCVLLCCASMCMEFVRRGGGLEFVGIAKKILASMKEGCNGQHPLPISSWLLALVEGSLSHKHKWQESLKLEWFAWPSGRMKRPAELLFQMHLLEEDEEFRKRWVLRSIHLNPSCSRYWTTLFSPS